MVSDRIEAMHAIERYSARDIRRLPLNQEQIQLDSNRKRSPYSVFAIIFFGAMRQLTRLERLFMSEAFYQRTLHPTN